MSLPAILIGLVLLVVAIPIVASPFRNKDFPKKLQDKQNKNGNQNNYELVLLTIRDLDFDHQLGILSEDDYKLLRQQYLVEAAEAYERKTPDDGDLAQLIESAVLERRQHIGNGRGQCSNCGADQNIADKFCSTCGFQAKITCSDCNLVVAQDDKFCISCGAQLKVVSGVRK